MSQGKADVGTGVQLNLLLPLKGGKIVFKDPIFNGKDPSVLRQEILRDLELAGLKSHLLPPLNKY